MARRTPLEVAIAATSEKQAKYEAKLRRGGLNKVCVWVPADRANELKSLARLWREALDRERAGS